MARAKIERKKAMSSYIFGSSEQVETYASLGEAFVNSQGNTQILGQGFFDKRIYELQGLKTALLSSEMQFFNQLRLVGSPRQCLDELQRRINSWNASGAGNLINGNVNNIIQRLMGLFSSVDIEELGQKYGDELIQQQIFKEIALEDGEEDINKMLVNFAQWVASASGKGTRGSVKMGEDGEAVFTGILQYIEIIKNENGKFKLVFKGNISNTYKVRLASIFNKMVEDEEKKIGIRSADYNTMKSEIASQILSMSGVGGDIAFYLRHEIEQRFFQYGYAQNPLVIKGFLGEVYWNGFFSYLMQTPGSTVPTGVVKDQSGKSITIDMVVKGFGFQIKNYNIDARGEVTFHGAMGAGNLIVNRAQITPSDALLYLFGTWAYNQPVEGATPEYQATYSEIENIVQKSSAVFQMYADRIIGLDKEFAAKKNKLGLYQQENLYYNSFFLINTKIVPGSSIIQAMIDSMQSQKPDIRFEAEYFKPTSGLWPNPAPASAYAAAQLAGVTYEVHMNVDNIIQLAYNRADDI